MSRLLASHEKLQPQKADGTFPVLIGIGSILQSVNLNRTAVWGAGCMWGKKDSTDHPLVGKPRLIKAVRGPYTRRILRSNGIECPKTYGDPALLFPKLLKPSGEEAYNIGIIPHVVDQGHPWLDQWRDCEDITIIDLRKSVEDVVSQITSCRTIVSSALHGIIVADAYKIPSLYLKLSDSVLGHGFKYRDYFASIHQEDCNTMVVTESTHIRDCLARVNHYKLNLNRHRLLRAFPGAIVSKWTNRYLQRKGEDVHISQE